MKTIKFFLFSFALALVFTSCKQEVSVSTTMVDFENITLNADSIWNGSDLSGAFTANNSIFQNSYHADWSYWTGFACSSKTDVVTSGYVNQYSAIAGSGALNSKKFAIAYDSATILIPKTADYYSIKSLYITNSTYAYQGIVNGNYGVGGVGKKFAADDWFKVTIKGYKANVLTSSVDVYLADFRNGKSSVLKTWTKFDVSTLGEVDKVTFTFDSSDKFNGWLNTPAYACIDNIEFTQPVITE